MITENVCVSCLSLQVSHIHRGECTALSVSRDGRYLLTAGDKVVKVWDYNMALDLNFQVLWPLTSTSRYFHCEHCHSYMGLGNGAGLSSYLPSAPVQGIALCHLYPWLSYIHVLGIVLVHTSYGDGVTTSVVPPAGIHWAL